MRMRLSPIGRYVYRELIDHCYIEGSLPGDTAILAKIADISLREFLKVWPEVSTAFRQSDDGRWHNPKVDEVLPELERWHEKKRIAGRAGGLAKHSNALAALQQNGSNAVASLKPSTSTSTEIPHTPIEVMCDEFIKEYPESRRNKPGSVERWYAANVAMCVNPQKLHNEVMVGLRRAKRSAAWAKADGKYICGMTNFLDDQRWKESWPESDGGYETPLTDLRDLD